MIKSVAILTFTLGLASAQYGGYGGLGGAAGGFDASSLSMGGLGGYGAKYGSAASFGRSPYGASPYAGLQGMGGYGASASSLYGQAMRSPYGGMPGMSAGYGGLSGFGGSPSSFGSSYGGASPYGSAMSPLAASSYTSSLSASPSSAGGYGSSYAAALAGPAYSKRRLFGSGLVHSVLSHMGPFGERVQSTLVGAPIEPSKIIESEPMTESGSLNIDIDDPKPESPSV
ncbi:hypothetical protein HDE_04410 [Halotydeus destructor]|nr:hypothetical protein HDE_04410 [Halotydeus destructor]